MIIKQVYGMNQLGVKKKKSLSLIKNNICSIVMPFDHNKEIDITWTILFKDHEYTSINHQYYRKWVCLYRTTLLKAWNTRHSLHMHNNPKLNANAAVYTLPLLVMWYFIFIHVFTSSMSNLRIISVCKSKNYAPTFPPPDTNSP